MYLPKGLKSAWFYKKKIVFFCHISDISNDCILKKRIYCKICYIKKRTFIYCILYILIQTVQYTVYIKYIYSIHVYILQNVSLLLSKLFKLYLSCKDNECLVSFSFFLFFSSWKKHDYFFPRILQQDLPILYTSLSRKVLIKRINLKIIYIYTYKGKNM